MSNIYRVVMQCYEEARNISYQIPTFQIVAVTPEEAIEKVQTMFRGDDELIGMVMRDEPHCEMTEMNCCGSR